MPWCYRCDRYFNTPWALEQHVENSTAHLSDDEDDEYECENCDKSFATERALHQHCSDAAGHPYCVSCKRMFRNQNNLNQHLHSKIHVGSPIRCPFCKSHFTTASGVTVHLESGTCAASGLNRTKINNMVQRLDRDNVITRPLLTMPGYDTVETIATERAWNGRAFECYLCPREFLTLQALNQHIKSPTHEQAMYRCPKLSCRKEYKLLSGLIQHVESESCGVMRFSQVQKQAGQGIQNMVGRMIAG